MTGASVPRGCNAVVPVEETQKGEGRVRVLEPVAAEQHIRFRGDDVAMGAVVIPAATLTRPPEISMLASMASVMVPVHRRARVAILSTGDELIELGQTPVAGKIITSSTPACRHGGESTVAA